MFVTNKLHEEGLSFLLVNKSDEFMPVSVRGDCGHSRYVTENRVTRIKVQLQKNMKRHLRVFRNSCILIIYSLLSKSNYISKWKMWFFILKYNYSSWINLEKCLF